MIGRKPIEEYRSIPGEFLVVNYVYYEGMRFLRRETVCLFVLYRNLLIKEDNEMACFVVPAAEAVIATIAAKVMESKGKEPETVQVALDGTELQTVEKLPFSRKLKWLSNMLWGGSGLLVFEHIWHGEVIPAFPFLTAAGNPAGMLQEVATAGVTMGVLVTAVWVGMLSVAAVIEKRALKPQAVKVRSEKR